jgi:diguanylate cyclase (GGDEF)-like protein/PAS domain S-box-containing protein
MRMSSENSLEQSHGGNGQHLRGNPGPERGLPALILVVDDHRTNRYLLQEVLKGRGYRVATAGDGAEALREARQNPPDLIVTDILMPVMDGFSLCWEWKHDERLKRIPLICYTGTYTDERNRQFALELGAERFVVNTGNPEDLVKVVREVLESSQRGGLAAVPPPAAENTVFLKQHNELLARKLEDKMRQLEQAHRGLQRDIAARMQAERANAQLAAIIESSDDAIISRALDGTILTWNAGAERLFGWTAGEAIGRNISLIVPLELEQEAAPKRAQVHAGHPLTARDTLRLTKDGRRIDVSITPSPIKNERGEVTGVSLIIQNISERRQQVQKIARLSRIHAVLSGLSSVIVRVRDREKLLKEACRIAVEHGGFGIAWISEFDPATLDVTRVAWAASDAGEPLGGSKSSARADIPQGQGVIGRAIRQKTPAVCNDIAAELHVGSGNRAEAIRRGYRAILCLPLLVEGVVWGTLTLYANEPDYFTDDEVKLLSDLAGNLSFALELLHKQEQLDYLAYHDALTGLPNRTLFEDRLTQQIRSASRDNSMVALVLLDLERFQVINDTFGGTTADRLLKLVAERLVGVIFDRDSLARVHADVFAALLSGVADEAGVARIVEEKIMGCLAPPFAFEGHELRVSARAGVALFPGDATIPDALFSDAEAALNQAKASGERYLFYAPQMNARVAGRLKLENKLRLAVERDEFVLYYQPKIDLREERVTGLEALIRWNDPGEGLVQPALFIPVLEETGLIVEVGAWVLKQAVTQYAEWRAAGMRPPRIAVNVSPLQLKRKDFVAVVEQAIAAAGDAGHGLDLEITESMIMEDVEASVEKLKAVRALGVEIAIDDFGTGYSSLQYLAQLPISALKIDRAFVRNMTTNANHLTLVATIISLAHSLDLKVIAEGVETEEQANYLRLHKCDQAQGFLFGKPAPAAQVRLMLRSAEKPVA